jgi:hypothetical protein
MKGVGRRSKKRLTECFSRACQSFIQKSKFDFVNFLLLFVFYSFLKVFLLFKLFIDVQRIVQTVRGIASVFEVSAVG